MRTSKSSFSILFILALSIVGCTNSKTDGSSNASEIPIREHSISAVLWQQKSAEYRALSYQAFNIATMRITRMESTSDNPLAIVTDLDETVLDNSPFNGMQIKEDQDFDLEDWFEWGKLQNANALPGAVQFFNLADSLGIEVFYISNRNEEQLDETIANLKTLNLPNADTSHVFLKTNTSEKQERRNRVLENYEVMLYMGDNLSDFSSVFDNQSTESRNQSVDQMQELFGDKFIVFPNPMYGDWESKGIYENNRAWSDQQKDSIRQAKINSYK